MMLILIGLIAVLAIGVAPIWPYSAGRSAWPSGLLGAVLIVLLGLAAIGRWW